MNVQNTIKSICSTVPKYESTYQSARSNEPAFAPYASASALVEAVACTSSLTMDQRQAVVRAVLLAQQRAPHPLWQGVLLRAFEPMLGYLRSRVRGIDGDDLVQQVLCSFFEATSKVRVDAGEPVFAVVRRATARALFGVARAEQKYAETILLQEHPVEPPPELHLDPPAFVQVLAREAVVIMSRVKGGEDVARSFAGDESVLDQAERLGATENAGYECLRKRRQRAIAVVREAMGEAMGEGKSP
jgi:hypothetical protein